MTNRESRDKAATVESRIFSFGGCAEGKIPFSFLGGGIPSPMGARLELRKI